MQDLAEQPLDVIVADALAENLASVTSAGSARSCPRRVRLRDERLDLAPERLVVTALGGKELPARSRRHRPRRVIEVFDPSPAFAFHSPQEKGGTL